MKIIKRSYYGTEYKSNVVTIGLIVLGGLLISGFVVIANTNVMPRISEKANALIKKQNPKNHHTK